MLGEMIAVQAGTVVGFKQLEPVGVELAERNPRVVHVVEHTELHADPPVYLRGVRDGLRTIRREQGINAASGVETGSSRSQTLRVVLWRSCRQRKRNRRDKP